MFNLYSYNYETLMINGYQLIATLPSEQECHDMADDFISYRIEELNQTGSRLIFDTESLVSIQE
jgi:hypothetical protein